MTQTNSNEKDIAVLQTQMEEVRADVVEIKNEIIQSNRSNEKVLERVARELRKIFEKHDEECRKVKEHDAQFRRETYQAIRSLSEAQLNTQNDMDKFRLERDVKFDLKKDWFKIAMAILGLLVAAGSLYIAARAG